MRTRSMHVAVLVAVLLGSVTLGVTDSAAEGCERGPALPIPQNPTTITCGVGI
jgi:hypothetical protein